MKKRSSKPAVVPQRPSGHQSGPGPTPLPAATPSASAAPQATASAPAVRFATGRRLRVPAFVPWLILALLALLVFLPALRAGFIWDDDALTANPALGSWSGLLTIWRSPSLMPHEQHYWPMVYSSFWLEHRFAGLRPFLYHLDNILLHGAACVLLWRVLRRLAVPGAWLAAALFAVHPVHAESVAWVIERKDVLSGVFYMAASLAFLRFDALPATLRRRWAWYGLSLALFAAALLSKSTVITLPVALALLLWLRRGRLARRDLLILAPLALLALAVTALDLSIYHGLRGAMNSGLNFPERALMAGGSLWRYLAKLAWPHPLATFYPKWQVALANPLSWFPILTWVGLLTGLWLARRRIGRGPFAGLAFFTLTLAPALGLIDFDFLRLSWLANRFQYLASAGPLALAAAGLTLLARRFRLPVAARAVGALALLAPLGVLGHRQASCYRDSVTLFQASAAAYPECWPAYFNLEWALMQEGRAAEAVAVFARMRERMPQPDYRQTHEMAVALDRQQQSKEAEKYYRETVQLNPDFLDGRISYGAFLTAQGRLREAEMHYAEALRLDPDHPAALNNLGNLLGRRNQLDRAEEFLARAVSLAPGNVDYRLNLASVLIARGKTKEAIAEGQAARRLDPKSFAACGSIGQALMARGEIEEAIVQFKEALRLEPQSLITLRFLGQAYRKLGDEDQSRRYYQEASQVQYDLDRKRRSAPGAR